MKLSLICLSFFLLPLFSFSQKSSSIDFVGGVDFSYRDMRVNNNPSFSDTLVVRIFDENETGKINFRFGFNFNKQITKNIFLKTGVRFVSLGYQRKYEDNELRWGSQQTGGVFDPSIPAPSDLPEISTFIYNYHFIEVPLIARYEFSQKKFTPFVELGAAPSFFLKSRNKIISDDGTQVLDHVDPQNNYSKLHLVGVVSLGGNYSINEGLQLFAQPTFRYHLTRLFNSGSIKEHLFNGGLEIGLRKKLGS